VGEEAGEVKIVSFTLIEKLSVATTVTGAEIP
jgi:hypothetical protein